MAKAIIEYDLGDADDFARYQEAAHATEMAMVLFQIRFNMRKSIEWWIDAEEMKGNKVSPYDVLDEIMRRIVEDMEDNGITENIIS